MRTILVVSRDRNFRSLLRAQLREEGFEAFGFETLDDAARALDTSAKPVLVCDLADAPESERSSLLSGWLPQVPTLVLASAAERCEFPGVQVLRRPVRIAEVLEAVKTLMKA